LGLLIIMKNALIIVDAWNYFDEVKDPWADRESKAFGRFLNIVCNYERTKGTQIFYDPSNHKIMNQISISSKDTILSDIKNIERDYDNFYFAGFHLDICVSGKADQLSNIIDEKKIGIVLNLSLLSFEALEISLSLKNISHNFYWWTRSGFSPLNIYKN